MRLNDFWRTLRIDTAGSTMTEFALVVPLMLALTLGSIGLGMMMYANVCLHFAVEQAARCASINATSCSGQTATSTYATGLYTGPTLTSLTFTLTAPSAGGCGNKVVGTGSFVLFTGLGTITAPISAQSCYAA